MRNNPRTLYRWLLPALFVLVLATTVTAQNRPAEPSLRGEGSLKVMTYNIHVGTEYVGVTDPNYNNFLQAVTNLIVNVRASDAPGRMQAIANQIAATKPHLVSLQEVATWSTGPTKDNLTVEFNFLQLLLDALTAQGAPYTPVGALTHFDVTLPSTIGFVRNTWRVVVIARADLKPEDFSFTNVQAAPWTAALVVPLPALNGLPALCPVALLPTGVCMVPFQRGWVAADVFYRDKQFRYIGAHLDSSSATREIAQGFELLNGPANTPLPVVVAGDLNADCGNLLDRTNQTCINLTHAGFMDAWTVANPSDPGYTKYFVPLYDPNAVLTKRGDLIMVRGRFGVQAAVLVGEEVGDMTPSGLWPSDHCGVVARLQLPTEE
jgi:endonuclease/exonuclease/phosphatase family metal-dependent hydrolase